MKYVDRKPSNTSKKKLIWKVYAEIMSVSTHNNKDFFKYKSTKDKGEKHFPCSE